MKKVLKKYDRDNFVLDGAGAFTFHYYAWAKQEKCKGRRSEVILADEQAGGTSDFCGWRFNNKYYKKYRYTENGVTYRIFDQMSYADIATLTDEDLRQNPFFEVGDPNLFFNSLNMKRLLNDSIDSVTPSNFVGSTITNYSGFKDYDISNNTVKQHLTMREWLLARAFPATTLPMGANALDAGEDENTQIPLFNASNNIDLATKMKANENYWPVNSSRQVYEGKLPWLHSDYKDLPYQYNFPFYKEIKKLVNGGN